MGEPNTIKPGAAEYCQPFEALDQDSTDLVGGKNASLGELIKAGAPVPPGFAVTTHFYRRFMDVHDLWELVENELDGVDPDDMDSVKAASEAIQAAIQSQPFPPELAEPLEEAFEDLKDQCGVESPRLAVRSSATAEDLPDASFAGQQDTYLNVQGIDDLEQKVRKCIASLFTGRAISYREENDFDHDDVEISVGVQQLVNAKCSGVMFTLNPQNGDRSKAQIEGNWGLGEAVVSGEVNPDNFLVDKVVLEVVERNISAKSIKTVVVDDGVENQEVAEERQQEPCLTDDELLKLTEYGKKIEKHYGQPQDIEWVIDSDLEFPDNIFVVQSRPETVWSQKEGGREISKVGKDSMEMIKDSLSKTW